MLFAHANGFNAGTYRRMLSSIDDRFDVFALDLRGHGRNSRPAEATRLADWSPYRDDVLAAVDAIEAEYGAAGAWRLAGHSLGGISVLLAAAERPELKELRLIDPPMALAPLWLVRSPLWAPIAARVPLFAGAKTRRSHWQSRADVEQSYARKPIFRRWAPGVLEDYLLDGLRDAPDGAHLACATDWEYATFAAQRDDNFKALRRVTRRAGAEVAIIGLGQDSPFWVSARRRAARLGAQVLEKNQAGHLWPMETPEEAAAFLS